ncbi:hypothetical protein BDA96_02G078100 [Sorghum bicolor]|uniref:Uncharacterized protein n=2 Tax=Sorghum bicolor TaxID=4558 RepID=A0A1W0W2W4_SORBI|nr:hypothetical protein BDA96_02G078100 [Sorghum bicolor]OQU88695.1 hypothetical protein SORBI_3002G076350 [Sorghum bicolor]
MAGRAGVPPAVSGGGWVLLLSPRSPCPVRGEPEVVSAGAVCWVGGPRAMASRPVGVTTSPHRRPHYLAVGPTQDLLRRAS